jgi:membrane protein
MKTKFGKLFTSAKKAFSGFFDDRGLKLSASLSYYTVFSLPSLLFMLIGLGGLFFGKDAIQGEVFKHISGFVGADAAKDIQEMLRNTSINKSNIWATIIGGLLLWFTAAGVFVEIQDSINFIWGIKAKPKKGLLVMVMNRLVSFSMILVLGFILMVSLFLSTMLHSFMDTIKAYFPDFLVRLFFVVDYAVMILVIVALFASIFKLLPDARLKFREVLPAAIFTSLLFFIGQFLIGFYLNRFGDVKVYGPASSLILIILWVYYSAIILYLGAEFTKANMVESGKKIIPLKYAEMVDDRMNREVEEKKVDETKKQFSLDGQDTKSNIRSI